MMSSASKDLHWTDEGQDEEAPERFVLLSFWWGFCGSLISLVSSRRCCHVQWSAWALGLALREVTVVKKKESRNAVLFGDFPGCCGPAAGEMLCWECWTAEDRVSHSCQAVVPQLVVLLKPPLAAKWSHCLLMQLAWGTALWNFAHFH